MTTQTLRVVCTLTALLCVGEVTSSLAQTPKRFYLGVGVEGYLHESLRKPEPLKYCVDDVTGLAEVLKTKGYDLTLLTDDAGKQNESRLPNKVNIEREIRRVLDAAQPGDTVLLALAGHGIQFAGDKEAYFCPIDARPLQSRVDSLVSTSSIYEAMKACHASSRVLLVDACRNDPDPTRGRGGDSGELRERGIDPLTARPPRGIAVFFSCDAGQKAFENDELQHGIFFHHVIEGIAGRAVDQDNEVTTNSLSGYVGKRVKTTMKKYNPDRLQQPSIDLSQIGEPMVLVEGVESTTKSSHIAGEIRDDIFGGIKLVYCPPGKFFMGSPADEAGRNEDEDDTAGPGGRPLGVNFEQGFWIGQTEVTQGQWKAVMGTEPWRDHGDMSNVQDNEDAAASYISYLDAREFCDRITQRMKGKLENGAMAQFSLPTESQWEYACRANSSLPFVFSDTANQIDEFAWWGGGLTSGNVKGQRYAHEVGRKKPNAWKLFDTQGNCLEWCSTKYASHHRSDAGKEELQSEPAIRVLKGGSWNHSGIHAFRPACRFRSLETERAYNTGFRVVLSE